MELKYQNVKLFLPHWRILFKEWILQMKECEAMFSL